MPHRDPVTPALRAQVLRRDGGCLAPYLGAPDGCRSAGGYPLPATSLDLELDHVRDAPMMGKRAPSDTAHLVALCHRHHQGGWATRNRPLLRRYLAAVCDGGLDSTTAARRILATWRAETGGLMT